MTSGLVALARSELATTHPKVGWTEQDPLRWWTTIVIACAEARAQAPGAFGAVDVVGLFGGAADLRAGDGQGDPMGKGILWSDRRGGRRRPPARRAHGRGRHEPGPHGIPLDAGAVAAKLAWLAEHMSRGGWQSADLILSPRDFIDLPHDRPGRDRRHVRLAQRSLRLRRQCRARAGRPRPGQAAERRGFRHRRRATARRCRVPSSAFGPGIPVVIGAGDRQCEVMGSGASEGCPMVSWGTTANVSVPVASARFPHRPAPWSHGRPTGGGCSRADSRLQGRSWPGWGDCSGGLPTSWPLWPRPAHPAPTG